MAVIPNFYKEATVAIGIKKKNTLIWVATGFLVGRFEGLDSNNEERYTIYLITNKHVVKDLDRIEIQYNYGNATKNISVELIDSSSKKYYSDHPRNDVDVIAMRINLDDVINNGIQLWFFSLKDNALNLQKMKDTGVGDGCLTYVLGFPVGITQSIISNILKEPICRIGCIAKIEHLYHQSNTDSVYLIDSNLFPGNSGGPVINRPESFALNGTSSNSSTCLIGIVGAYLPYQETLYSRQTNRDRMIMEENSGLAVVYPVDYILEVVEIERTRTTNLNPDQKLKLP